MKIPVKENEKLVRDTNTFAILNTDTNALNSHNKKMAEIKRRKVAEDEINTIKHDISEIKQMLSNFLKSK